MEKNESKNSSRPEGQLRAPTNRTQPQIVPERNITAPPLSPVTTSPTVSIPPASFPPASDIVVESLTARFVRPTGTATPILSHLPNIVNASRIVASNSVPRPVLPTAVPNHFGSSFPGVFDSIPVVQIQDIASRIISNSSLPSEPQGGLQPEEDDQVTYLFQVDSSQNQQIELVDLTESDQDALVLPADPSISPASPEVQIQNQTPGTDVKAKKNKRKSSDDNSRVKRQSKWRWKAHCVVCGSDYDSVLMSGSNLLISNCGHMYCEACNENMDSLIKKCVLCMKTIYSLYKVYL